MMFVQYLNNIKNQIPGYSTALLASWGMLVSISREIYSSLSVSGSHRIFDRWFGLIGMYSISLSDVSFIGIELGQY